MPLTADELQTVINLVDARLERQYNEEYQNDTRQTHRISITGGFLMDRELLLELKEFLTERMVDNMSTKDLEEYVANDLFTYFDKLGEHEFLEEARNYWDDGFDEVVAEVQDYMKCDVKKERGTI